MNLAGLGIKEFELTKKVKNFLVVFVGTGIGGALFFDRKLYRGSSFFAGEIGHMKVSETGSLASTGSAKSFEEIASRTAIADSIILEMKNGTKSILSEIYQKHGKIKSRDLAWAVEKKDRLAIEKITSACSTIGAVLASITTLLNLDRIVLGGGLVEALPEFTTGIIHESFLKNVLEESGMNVKITATNLGDDAPLLGGIPLYKSYSRKRF